MKILVLILLMAAAVIVPTRVAGQADDETSLVDAMDAVFQIAVMDRRPGPDGIMHTKEYGTGFFIASDGTGLTASHVVYRAVHQPERYRLVVDAGKEFYDAQVVCATTLPYDPTKPDDELRDVPVTRDVAVIKLAPSTAPAGHRRRFFTTASGQQITVTTAHMGPLPAFPALALGDRRGPGVRVIAFDETSLLLRTRVAGGEVVRWYASPQDGTPLFDVRSAHAPGAGGSGAPVLNDRDQVVGMWAWGYDDKPGTGTAEGSQALKNPCR